MKNNIDTYVEVVKMHFVRNVRTNVQFNLKILIVKISQNFN